MKLLTALQDLQKFGCAALACISCSVLAQEPATPDADYLYVADRFEVPVRQTGCNTCTIVHYGLASGTRVIDLGEENSDGWRKIRTQGGITGWMPGRFLFDQPIAAERLTLATERLQALELENQMLVDEIAQLENQLQNMGLSVTRIQPEDPSQPATLKLIGDVSTIDSQNEALLVRNQELQRELDILVASNERLQDDAWRTWFFYGGLAVFAGALLSSLLPRLRPRKRYDGWG